MKGHRQAQGPMVLCRATGNSVVTRLGKGYRRFVQNPQICLAETAFGNCRLRSCRPKW